MPSITAERAELLNDIQTELDAIRTELRRRCGRNPQTFAELVAWEGEFGESNDAECEKRNGDPISPAFRRERYKGYARMFNLPYATVKDAVETARAERAELREVVHEVLAAVPFIRLGSPDCTSYGVRT